MNKVLLLCAAVVVASCASVRWGGAASMAEEKFPSRAEVAKLLARPPVLDVAKVSADPVEEWELVGPFPDTLTATPVRAESAWEKALVSANPAFAQALTEDHRCIAREVARYVAAKQKSYPGHSLERFIESRCATTAKDVHLRSLTGTVPKNVTEEKWLEEWKADVAKMAKLDGADLAGIAVAREGDSAALIIATSEAGAIFAKPVPVVAKGLTTVELRGRLGRGGAYRIGAVINQGELGSEECHPLDATSPPEFAFSCTVKAGDTRAAVEIGAFDEGRILGRKVVDFVVFPTGEAPKKWSRPKGSQNVPEGLFAARFLAEVNAFRQRAGLGMLTEAKDQSATAALLAPHYFAASFGQTDPLDGDLVALAMMAGWDVPLEKVSSHFGGEWMSGTRDLGLFLEFVLDSPFQRQALTDPRATHIGLGAVDSPGALGVLFATYVPLPKFDRKEAEIAIITRLNTLRLERSLPLAQWTLWPEDEGQVIEAQLAAHRWGPADASQHALEKTAAVAKGRVRGYLQLVDDLDHFQFPPEVLLRPDINVFLAVATYKGEDWAQTRYVVCFVLASKGDIETASR